MHNNLIITSTSVCVSSDIFAENADHFFFIAGLCFVNRVTNGVGNCDNSGVNVICVRMMQLQYYP